MSIEPTVSSSNGDHVATQTVLSMSGQGHASVQNDLGLFRVEVRTVNHRGLKCNLRTSDGLQPLESRIESRVRALIHRGSVMLKVSWKKPPQQQTPEINRDLLAAYARSLLELKSQTFSNATSDLNFNINLASLLELPGVLGADVLGWTVDEGSDLEVLWKAIDQVMVAAFENLNQMRAIEGANMAVTLRQEAKAIGDRVRAIETLAPRAVENHAQRLEGKIQRILSERDIESQPIDLLREVQIYADRADISEEITRLDSHLALFESVLSGNSSDPSAKDDGTSSSQRREPSGRKLDFIIQEMFRETNTIGSKAADAEVASHVVEIKCAVERMRELVQNLE